MLAPCQRDRLDSGQIKRSKRPRRREDTERDGATFFVAKPIPAWTRHRRLLTRITPSRASLFHCKSVSRLCGRLWRPVRRRPRRRDNSSSRQALSSKRYIKGLSGNSTYSPSGLFSSVGSATERRKASAPLFFALLGNLRLYPLCQPGPGPLDAVAGSATPLPRARQPSCW